jgi:hypothetical protein
VRSVLALVKATVHRRGGMGDNCSYYASVLAGPKRIHGIEVEYWDDEDTPYSIYTTPSWLYSADYYHLRAASHGLEFEMEVVSRPYQASESVLLIYIKGQPPFSAIAQALSDYLQGRGYRSIDSRPPCVVNLSRPTDSPVYFRRDPDDPSRGIPHFEIGELLETAIRQTDLVLANENTPFRTLVLYQLHSLADHASSVFLSRLVSDCTVIPTQVTSDSADWNTLGRKLDGFHCKLGLLLGWEYDAAAKANTIRNRLYHAERSFRTHYVDYRSWYDIEDPLHLVPVPRQSDMYDFLGGINKLLVALGTVRLQRFQHDDFPVELPSRVRESQTVYSGRSYLNSRSVRKMLNGFLVEYVYPHHGQPAVCDKCGMRMYGLQAKRCLFCCPECGKQNAVLHKRYACGHANHPLFGAYSSLIGLCLPLIDEFVSEGRLGDAVQISRLCFDLAASAAWLEGKNYFDVLEKLRDLGICLAPDLNGLRQSHPDLLSQPEHWRGLQIMQEIESSGSISAYFAGPPAEADYQVARALLDRSFTVLQTPNLPDW